MKMDDILLKSFGESSNEVKATFRRVIKIRDFETEEVTLENKLTFDRELTNAERINIESFLQAQIEYSVYANLVFKGLITAQEFEQRKLDLETEVNNISQKVEELTNRQSHNEEK